MPDSYLGRFVSSEKLEGTYRNKAIYQDTSILTKFFMTSPVWILNFFWTARQRRTATFRKATVRKMRKKDWIRLGMVML